MYIVQDRGYELCLKKIDLQIEKGVGTIRSLRLKRESE